MSTSSPLLSIRIYDLDTPCKFAKWIQHLPSHKPQYLKAIGDVQSTKSTHPNNPNDDALCRHLAVWIYQNQMVGSQFSGDFNASDFDEMMLILCESNKLNVDNSEYQWIWKCFEFAQRKQIIHDTQRLMPWIQNSWTEYEQIQCIEHRDEDHETDSKLNVQSEQSMISREHKEDHKSIEMKVMDDDNECNIDFKEIKIQNPIHERVNGQRRNKGKYGQNTKSAESPKDRKTKRKKRKERNTRKKGDNDRKTKDKKRRGKNRKESKDDAETIRLRQENERTFSMADDKCGVSQISSMCVVL